MMEYDAAISNKDFHGGFSMSSLGYDMKLRSFCHVINGGHHWHFFIIFNELSVNEYRLLPTLLAFVLRIYDKYKTTFTHYCLASYNFTPVL